MESRSTANRGFSLLELLVVLVILSVLTATAIPYYQNAVQSARNAEAVIWWGGVKRWTGGASMNQQRAERIEKDVNENGKLKYFTLSVLCREKENETEPCWEAELRLKDSSQHLQYYLATEKNFSTLLCVPLNSAGNSFCQGQSGQDGPPDRRVNGQDAYVIRY